MSMYIYYPTLLVIVQKTHETSTNIARYYIFGYLYCGKPVLQVGYHIFPRARHAKTCHTFPKKYFLSRNSLFTIQVG